MHELLKAQQPAHSHPFDGVAPLPHTVEVGYCQVGTLLGSAHKALERVGGEPVVCICESDPASAAVGEGLIARAGDAAVFLGDDVDAGVTCRSTACDGNAVVLRAVVDEDELEVTQRLVDEAFEEAFDGGCGVVHGDNDADERCDQRLVIQSRAL